MLGHSQTKERANRESKPQPTPPRHISTLPYPHDVPGPDSLAHLDDRAQRLDRVVAHRRRSRQPLAKPICPAARSSSAASATGA
jgi:hypothetical protein